MADCFSMPNVAELVTALRNHAEYCDMPFTWMNEAYAQAADAIEQLLSKIEQLEAESAKLKAERDAAVGDLRDNGSCFFCKHFEETDYCERGCRWEWRGVQNE